MTTTPESRESVEKLADAIVIHDVRGKHWDLDGIKVVHRINAFLRSHNIDPATMKPIATPAPVSVDTTARCEPKTDVEQLQKSMVEYEAGNSQDVQEIIDEFKAAGADEVHILSDTTPPPQPERHRVTCGNCGTTTWSNEGHSPCNPKEWSAWQRCNPSSLKLAIHWKNSEPRSD